MKASRYTFYRIDKEVECVVARETAERNSWAGGDPHHKFTTHLIRINVSTLKKKFFKKKICSPRSIVNFKAHTYVNTYGGLLQGQE